ncbi:MAG: metalloregulator ArsR/SmtB family transcription factor [Bacteroidota bacterium]
MDYSEIFKALSNKSRLQILHWLKDPVQHFPEQQHNGYENGVCVGIIQQKCGLTQSTVSDYLAILQRVGLVEATRIGQWTYYRRNEAAFAALGQIIENKI